jgi:hypothetical protein
MCANYKFLRTEELAFSTSLWWWREEVPLKCGVYYANLILLFAGWGEEENKQEWLCTGEDMTGSRSVCARFEIQISAATYFIKKCETSSPFLLVLWWHNSFVHCITTNKILFYFLISFITCNRNYWGNKVLFCGSCCHCCIKNYKHVLCVYISKEEWTSDDVSDAGKMLNSCCALSRNAHKRSWTQSYPLQCRNFRDSRSPPAKKNIFKMLVLFDLMAIKSYLLGCEVVYSGRSLLTNILSVSF